MQREIKFRAWNSRRKKMLNGVGVHPHLMMDLAGDDDYYNTHEDGRYLLTPNDSDIILMQYTGLKDKNGVEIYEGDVLEICNGSINGHKWPEPNRVVKYEKTGFNLHDFMWDKNGNSAMDSTHYCEIIGNIHANH